MAKRKTKTSIVSLDDDTPATRQWLLQCGGRGEDNQIKVTFKRRNALAIGFWQVSDGWKVMLIHHDYAASCIVRGLQTRGEVRRFCSAVGVVLRK